MGLVQKCVPSEQLMDTCLEIAQRIAERAPKSMTAIKKIIHTSRQSVMGAGLMAEQEHNYICTSSKDTGEGIAAMIEKRKPIFKNE